jgi:transposase
VDYSDSAVRAILHKLDFVHKQVKRVPSKADAALQEAFVKEFETL